MRPGSACAFFSKMMRRTKEEAKKPSFMRVSEVLPLEKKTLNKNETKSYAQHTSSIGHVTFSFFPLLLSVLPAKVPAPLYDDLVNQDTGSQLLERNLAQGNEEVDYSY